MKSVLLLSLVFITSITNVNNVFANPLFNKQWGIENTGQAIHIREAQYSLPAQYGIVGVDINKPVEEHSPTKGKDVVVAVIDTGVDLQHPDLVGRFWMNPNCSHENTDLCIGKNLLATNKPAYDDKGHGTHVAGIIAANDNEIGIEGVASKNIKIMPIKVLSNDINSFSYKGRNISDYFSAAIEFAIDNKADVINMSVGFPSLVLTQKFRDAINRAYSHNIPIIVAAGNNNKDIPVFPCSLENIICVGSVDNQGKISEFSNYGHMVDILAPGQSIVSTYPVSEANGPMPSRVLRIAGYESKQGTSQAAPFVSAISAMIKLKYPGISVDDLMAKLYATTRKSSLDENKFSLNGIVDMNKAMNLKSSPKYVLPIFKENAQSIISNKELNFSYKLKLKKLFRDSSDILVEVEDQTGIEFFKNKITIQTNINESDYTVDLSGSIASLSTNSLVALKLFITSNNIKREFKANLSFSMNIDALEVVSVPITNLDPNLAFAKRGKRTFSRLNYVHSATNEAINPEYFSVKKITQNENELSVIKPMDDKQVVKMKLKSELQVVNIIKGDFNLDSTEDYLVLTYQGSKDETKSAFYLYYLDKELEPLFDEKNYIFRIADDSKVFLIPDGGNLFNFDKRLVNFSWVRELLSPNQSILLPVVEQNGLIPSIDNTMELIEFEPPSLSNRLYRFDIKKDQELNTLTPRLLLNKKNENQLIESLIELGEYIQPWDTLIIETPYIQPQRNNGVLQYIVSIGEVYNRKFYTVNFSHSGIVKAQPLHLKSSQSSELNLAGSSSFNFQKNQKNTDQKNTLFFKLEGRSAGRAVYLGEEQVVDQLISSSGYSDPLFGFITADYRNLKLTTFFESRYWIHMFNGKKTRAMKYPVNRESSFPGVEFSETMEGIYADINGKIVQGVFVNSTLLYGNQVHAVLPIGDKLIRPIGGTLDIPPKCTYMLPEVINDDLSSSFSLTCIENGKTVIKYIPVKF